MKRYSSENYLFYFMLIGFLVKQGRSVNNSCTQICGELNIQFPFRIKDKHPPHCGYYPGFDLSCTENNQTVLELPVSGKLFIEKIDYVSQEIHTTDPNGCFGGRFVNFSLSGSAFHLSERYYVFDYTFFKCSKAIRHYFWNIPCLSSADYQVYAFPSGRTIDDLSLLSCTKMYDVSSIPLSIPGKRPDNILSLRWRNPACGHCARKNKFCRLKDKYSTGSKVECYYDIPSKKTIGKTQKALICAGIFIGSCLLLVLITALYRIYRFDKTEREYQSKIEKFLADYKAFNPTRYLYADLKRITNQFKDELGQGAYGTVFRGKLSDEIQVAVKVLNDSKGNGEEFVNEVGMMAKIHHVNVVRLIGFCADGFRRALVYEYRPNDSLQKFISSADAKSHFLGWKRLQSIALGIAKGIEYLHQGCDQIILHFDIKPHNVLLDHDFNPKISDFGLAKLCAKDQSAISMTTARGTIGYIAPEVFSRNFGKVSYKSDVYSFGMLVLEMVGGHKIVYANAGDVDQIYFPEWIYNLLEGGEDLRFDVEEDGDAETARRLAIVGLWCIQWNPMDRPSMKVVVQMLEGDTDNLTIPPNPFSAKASATMNAIVPARRHCHHELDVIEETE